MDNTASYVNYQPYQIRSVIFKTKVFHFLKKIKFNKRKEKIKDEKIPYSPSKIFSKLNILHP